MSNILSYENLEQKRIELERGKFEAWVRHELGVEPELWLPHMPSAGYKNSRIQDYWFGWLARSRVN